MTQALARAHIAGRNENELHRPPSAGQPRSCSVTRATKAKQAKQAKQMLTLVTIAALGITGCSSPDADRDEPNAHTSTSQVSPTSEPTNPTDRAINKLTRGKTVQLTTATLPKPPAGFTAAEVTAFGDLAIDLVKRGISPTLTNMTPAQAFNYVFANQYPESTDATRNALEAIGDYDYEWAVASQFTKPPTQPAEVLAARWQVSTSPGQTAAGATAPRLLVVLSVAVQHQVPVEDPQPGESQTAPIVMQRTYFIQGFEPLGGRSWWPGIGVQAAPYFGGKCAPINGSILTPATRISTLRQDLEDLRKYLTEPKTLRGGTSDAGDLAAYVDKYCENP